VLLGDPPGQVPLRKPDITAPGVTIRSALRATDDRYGNLSGTSLAGPHVAGLVALLIAADPGPRSDTLEDARAKLQKALDALGKSPPARQAAMGAIEGAWGDLEAAAAEGYLDVSQRTRLLDRLTGST
jgi:subtilisin family serine protease